MKIEYIANINNTGYGRAAKAYIKRISDLGHKLKIIPIYPQSLQIDKIDLVDKRVQELLDKPGFSGKPDIRIIHEVPHVNAGIMHIQKDGVYTVWFYAWELDVLPPMFKEVLSQVDMCVTFAHWQVETYKRCIGKDNIMFIPHVMPYESTVVKKAKNPSIFTFFSMFRWDERKDPLSLIKSYIYTFNTTDNVRLILKSSAVSDQTFECAVNNIMKFSRLNKNLPTITCIPGYLSQSELESLYLEADVFVSPTRGEGWGYGFNEALLYGIPCIYPDSPYLPKEVFNEQNSMSVPTHDTMVYNSSFPQVTADMKWSQTNEVELGKVMMKCYKEYDTLFKLPVTIGEQYKIDQLSINSKLEELFSKVGK